jgi:predicted molibdopterin-dependent oxidoreductase YjgC
MRMEHQQASEPMNRRVENGLQRGRAVEIVVDGLPVRAFEGESVAAALLAAGTRVLRTTARHGAPRGLYCGIGLCFECVMTVDCRPNVRTCQTPVRDGMQVETQQGEGRWPDAASRPWRRAGA